MTAQSMFLNGKRIYLREVRPTDVNETYYRWMNNSSITDFLESRFIPQSIEKIREYVTSKLGDTENIFLAIVMKEGDRHIGNIKIGPIHWIHRTGDIGIIIGEEDCWGQGYASEAISLLTDYAFKTLNLHKVTAGAYGNNLGSVKAFEKSGFVVEGIKKNHFYFKGAYVDNILMAKWNKEF